MNKIKILIVDDHPMMREALQTAFEGEDDLEMIGEAPDAIKALKMLETLKPDVIMMDMLLPGMSGLELLTHIREDFPAPPPPVVMMITAYGDEENHRHAMENGADDFLTKPLDFNLLKEKLKTFSE